jgi:hypothetical protein
VTIHLSARSTYSRPFATVENFKVDAGAIRGRRHHAIQRVDLPHEVALANSANRRIAGQRSDGVEPMGEQQGARAHAGRSGGGLTSGMTPANHDDIEFSAFRLRRATDRSAPGNDERWMRRKCVHHGAVIQPRRLNRYLPIQNSPKMRSRSCSTPTFPVMPPKAVRARRKASALNSGSLS